MNETTLRDFFLGVVGPAELARDVENAIENIDEIRQVVRVRDLDSEFHINRQMLVRLCDTVLAGELPPASLEPIAFVLLTSDRFDWEEDDLLADVLNDWDSPVINYPLTLSNIERCKRWLLEVEPHPQRPPLDPNAPQGKLIYERHRVKLP